ncbi:hypothetical protein FOA52_006208 [Chlamydomonas sp. UWO 241]|nr:hypothetical protein FOA52_006208 [Chlamydomonas sp. UWO 241]
MRRRERIGAVAVGAALAWGACLGLPLAPHAHTALLLAPVAALILLALYLLTKLVHGVATFPSYPHEERALHQGAASPAEAVVGKVAQAGVARTPSNAGAVGQAPVRVPRSKSSPSGSLVLPAVATATARLKPVTASPASATNQAAKQRMNQSDNGGILRASGATRGGAASLGATPRRSSVDSGDALSMSMSSMSSSLMVRMMPHLQAKNGQAGMRSRDFPKLYEFLLFRKGTPLLEPEKVAAEKDTAPQRDAGSRREVATALPKPDATSQRDVVSRREATATATAPPKSAAKDATPQPDAAPRREAATPATAPPSTAAAPGQPRTVEAAAAAVACDRTADAEAYFRQERAEMEDALGEDHADTLSSTARLAGALHAAGKLEEAEGLARSVLSGRLSLLGPDHLDTLASQAGLSAMLHAQDKLKEASVLCSAALEGRRTLLGPAHRDTLASLQCMCALQYSTSDFKGMEASTRNLSEMRGARFGNNARETLAACGLLAASLHGQGKITAAIKVMQDTLSAQERTLGPDAPDCERSREQLEFLMGETLASWAAAKKLQAAAAAPPRRPLHARQ